MWSGGCGLKGACENCGAMTQEKGLFGDRWVWSGGCGLKRGM